MNLVAVFVGGAVGTLLRFFCGVGFTGSDLISPWIINLLGSFILGLLVSWIWMLAATPTWLKVGLGTGVLGGFTTFSAIALDLAQSFSGDSTVLLHTVLLFIAELACGLLAAWGGLRVGSALASRVGGRAGLARASAKNLTTDQPITDEGVDL